MFNGTKGHRTISFYLIIFCLFVNYGRNVFTKSTPGVLRRQEVVREEAEARDGRRLRRLKENVCVRAIQEKPTT
jgi:hypothetical protein